MEGKIFYKIFDFKHHTKEERADEQGKVRFLDGSFRKQDTHSHWVSSAHFFSKNSFIRYPAVPICREKRVSGTYEI